MQYEYSSAQRAGAIEALRKLREQDVPQWEQSYINDQILEDVANTILNAGNADDAFIALQQYRQNNLPWFEQGAVSDDLLHTLVNVVLAAIQGK